MRVFGEDNIYICFSGLCVWRRREFIEFSFWSFVELRGVVASADSFCWS